MQYPCLDDVTIDRDIFRIIVNGEFQHSLWPAAIAIPEGWSSAGVVGDKATCLAYLDVACMNIRPCSLPEPMHCASRYAARV